MIISAAIDIKLTEDGDVKIIDVNASHLCENTGYWAVTGQDILEDVIYPDLSKQFNASAVRLDLGFMSNWSSLVFYSQEDIDNNRKKIILPENNVPMSCMNFILQDIPLEIIPQHVNARAALNLITMDKALADEILEAVAQEKPDLFPWQLTLPKDITKRETNKHLKHKMACVEQADQFFIKLPTVPDHNHMILVDREDLPEIILTAGRKNRMDRSDYKFSKEWYNCIHPFFVIQERVRSKPVIHNDEAYDATMRVYVSGYNDHHDKNFKMIFHDAVWHLPWSPINKATNLLNWDMVPETSGYEFMNAVPPSCKDMEFAFQCSEIARCYTKGPPGHSFDAGQFFAPVSDDDKQLVRDRVETDFPAIFDVFNVSPAKTAQDHLLNTGIKTLEDAAIMILSRELCSDRYQLSDEIMHGATDNALNPYAEVFTDEMIDKIFSIYKSRPRSAVSKYLRDLRDGKRLDGYSGCLDWEFREKIVKCLPKI